MTNHNLFEYILDSVANEIVFCDIDHKIVYMNANALEKYKDSDVKVGDSILACHKKESSHKIIKEGLEKLKTGKNRVFIYKSSKTGENAYLVGVRDSGNQLLGYYEWFERESS